jgi:MFS family permease
MKYRKRKNKEIEQVRSNFVGNLESNSSIKPVKISTYAWKLLIILSCTATMVMYAETMLIPAIPTLIHDFDVTYGLSSWLLTAYLVSGAVMTPIVGKLSDIYGRKRILLIVMTIYAIGVSCAGFSNDIYVMIIARAIQGVGMSMFPSAFGIIRDQFPREKVSIAQGIITSMFATGAVIGLSVGGIIIQHFGWRMTFFTIIPISIILIIVIRKFVHLKNNDLHDVELNNLKSYSKPLENKKIETNMKKDAKLKIHIDIRGSILLAVTIVSFLLAITLLQSTSVNVEKN